RPLDRRREDRREDDRLRDDEGRRGEPERRRQDDVPSRGPRVAQEPRVERLHEPEPEPSVRPRPVEPPADAPPNAASRTILSDRPAGAGMSVVDRRRRNTQYVHDW